MFYTCTLLHNTYEAFWTKQTEHLKDEGQCSKCCQFKRYECIFQMLLCTTKELSPWTPRLLLTSVGSLKECRSKYKEQKTKMPKNMSQVRPWRRGLSSTEYTLAPLQHLRLEERFYYREQEEFRVWKKLSVTGSTCVLSDILFYNLQLVK